MIRDNYKIHLKGNLRSILGHLMFTKGDLERALFIVIVIIVDIEQTS